MQQEKPKAFIVKMSVKDMDVKIDEDEVEKVFIGIGQGHIVRVRQGVVNPSFFAGIVEDVERVKEYMDEVNRTIDQNRKYEQYRIGSKSEIPEFTKLKDIFEGVKLPTANKKQLT